MQQICRQAVPIMMSENSLDVMYGMGCYFSTTNPFPLSNSKEGTPCPAPDETEKLTYRSPRRSEEGDAVIMGGLVGRDDDLATPASPLPANIRG